MRKSGYYDFKYNPQTCSKCGWTGPGKEAELGDTFRDGAEYHCPKCGERFGFVGYPFHEEVLTDPRSDPADRIQAELALRALIEDSEADPAERQQAETALRQAGRIS